MNFSARDIHFAWPDAPPLLTGVNLDLAPGELVAIVGANGSGKSTLLRILAGLLDPASGRVDLDGVSVHGLGHGERARQIAFLPQGVQPLYATTVRRMVELARHPWRGLARAEQEGAVDDALRSCDVLDLAGRNFEELSGGERQRVLMAGAFAQGGTVLLLDEPTAAVDLPHAVSLFRVLRGQLDEGTRSALVATHDLNLAAAWADRLLLLHDGDFLAAGTPAEVLTEESLIAALGEGIEVIVHPRHGHPRVLPRGRGPMQ